MLNNNGSENVFLASGGTDMRKSIDGLAAIVQESFSLDPFSSSLFVFCNKSRNKLKILQWDSCGFWLYYRRLERGRFQWPDVSKRSPVVLTMRELRWLLDGLSPDQKKAHVKVSSNVVI
jgi:transposase